MDVIPRHLSSALATALLDTPVVLVNGPRQSGKTTLVQSVRGSLPYYTLDDATVLSAAKSDPAGFARRVGSAVIDEVQHAPALLRAIKQSVDADRRPGRFILTGSADLMSLPTVAESLAGRMEILTLLPLSQAEITRRPAEFLERACRQDWSGSLAPLVAPEQVLQGGYPEMLQRDTTARRNAWANSYLKALVERDVRDRSDIEKLDALPRLLALLAELTGQLLNLTQLGGQIGLDAKTAQKYIGILEGLFLVRRVAPWGRNALGRQVKTPKLHFLDSGLQASLVRLTPEQCVTARHRYGAALESWVHGEIRKAVSLTTDDWQVFHYRDKDQYEVDFVLENRQRQVVGVEVKAAATVTSGDFRGLRKLQQLAGTDFLTGILLYDGEHALPYGEGLWAVPLGCL